jgi:hypothetical protein
MNILIFKELMQRIKCKSPKFFVILQYVFGAIALLCLLVGLILGELEIYEKVQSICYKVMIFSTGVVLTGQTTKDA